MTRMRWVLVLTVLALMAAACGGGTSGTTAASGETTAASGTGDLADLGGRTITVAVENAYLPFNYIDPATGEGAGWDYDALGEICGRINCTPEFVATGWEGMILAVSEDQFDMAADGITITPERAEQVDFSDGYISVEQRLLARLDEDRFATLDEFKAGDFTIGTQTGTTNFETAVARVRGGAGDRILRLWLGNSGPYFQGCRCGDHRRHCRSRLPG